MKESGFSWQRRVSYADCTAGNHVYHSRYLDLLEAARGEFFRQLGRTLLELQEQDVIFPVVEARLRYKFMARYDDVLTIEVWPTEVGRVRLNFGHRIVNQDGKLIMECETFHACTRIDGKPRPLPAELAAVMRPSLRGDKEG
ncbi:MAG TPA: thioesterase family protein [Verrucomicrobiota bacterium]|nr:thioesterase family protein [Verrucomicrobiota bacterium]